MCMDLIYIPLNLNVQCRMIPKGVDICFIFREREKKKDSRNNLNLLTDDIWLMNIYQQGK